MHRILRAIRRRVSFLRHVRALTFGQRLLRVVSNASLAPEDILSDQIRISEDGAPYFDLAGTRIYFCPDDALDDESRRREVTQGAMAVLREAYFRKPEFFCPEVRIQPGDTVLDLGGHIGTAALLFSRLTGPRGRVITFEPLFPDVLRRNLKENGADNVVVVPVAVGNRTGEVEFAITDLGIDSRIDPGGDGGRRRMMPVTTIDAYREKHGLGDVDFIKMDIEGAEEQALRGAFRTLRDCRPKLSIASYHSSGGFVGDPQHPTLVHLLDDLGYEIREIDERRILAW